MQKELPKFKIRCSGISQIMTESRGKSKAEKLADLRTLFADSKVKHDALKDGLKTKASLFEKMQAIEAQIREIESQPEQIELSDTAKTFCQNWIKNHLYDRRREFNSKYTDKGNKVEFDAMQYAETVLQWGFTTPCEEPKENDFLTGFCDVLRKKDDVLHDIKCSWDCFTFPLFSQTIPDAAYEWQVQGYMELYGVKNASVIYCLMDMPDDLLQKEAYFKFGYNFSKEQFEQVKEVHTYSHLPDKLRIKEYTFQHDPEKIARIERRVSECQQYINSLISNYNDK